MKESNISKDTLKTGCKNLYSIAKLINLKEIITTYHYPIFLKKTFKTLNSLII